MTKRVGSCSIAARPVEDPMRTSPMIALILTSLTLAFPACGGKPKTASVGGDVYLLMQNGDVKRGAANTVRLLADSPSLLQGMDRLCRVYAGRRYTIGAAWRRASAADLSSFQARSGS